jgi:hypothetical protein
MRQFLTILIKVRLTHNYFNITDLHTKLTKTTASKKLVKPAALSDK